MNSRDVILLVGYFGCQIVQVFYKERCLENMSILLFPSNRVISFFVFFPGMFGNTWRLGICKACVTLLLHCLLSLMMRQQLTPVSASSWPACPTISPMVERWTSTLPTWGEILTRDITDDYITEDNHCVSYYLRQTQTILLAEKPLLILLMKTKRW